jgi:hypothetical protein
MAEIAPAGGGPNRLFLIIAIGLGGLLVIGIIAVGAFFLLNSMSPKPAVVPTVAVKVAVTTPTIKPTSTIAPTDTPAPTNTAVLSVANVSSSSASSSAAGAPLAGGGVVTATGTFTGTPGTGTPGTGQLPKSGLGENLLLLVGGIVLVLVIFVARRARSVGAA